MSFSRMKIGYCENRNIDECRRKPIDVGGMGARISAFTRMDIDDCRINEFGLCERHVTPRDSNDYEWEE